MSRRLQYDPETVRKVCAESGSMLAAARRLGVNINTLCRIAKKLDCYRPNQHYRPADYIPRHYNKEDIEREFLSNKRTICASALRSLLVREGIKKACCEGCGNVEWRGRAIPLELHHKDGNRYNNHLDNLAILCPNCHAWETNGSNVSMISRGEVLVDRGYQDKSELLSSYVPPKITSSDKGRRKVAKKTKNKKSDVDRVSRAKKTKVTLSCAVCGASFAISEHDAKYRKYCSYACARKASERFSVSRDELLAAFRIEPNYTKVGRAFGVSDNAVKKRCKRLGIYEEVDKLIEREKVNRGMRAAPNIHTKESTHKSVESRLAHLDDYVCYRLAGFEFIEVCRYKSKRELEEAGYKIDIVNRACRGDLKTYRGLYWRREKKASSDKAS